MAVPQEGLLQPHSSPQLPTTTYGGRERSHSHPMMTIFRTRHRAAPGMLLPYPWQPPPAVGTASPRAPSPITNTAPNPGAPPVLSPHCPHAVPWGGLRGLSEQSPRVQCDRRLLWAHSKHSGCADTDPR